MKVALQSTPTVRSLSSNPLQSHAAERGVRLLLCSMPHPQEIIDEVLLALTHQVRFLTAQQIARAWTGGDAERALALIDALVDRQLAKVESRLVHPEFEDLAPQLTWRPGKPVPDFRPVAYRLRSRWKAPKEEMPLVFATDDACGRYGGTNVPPRSSEVSHDLHMGSLFVEWLGGTLFDGKGLWRSGDWLRSHRLTGEFREHVPDAALLDGCGNITHLVEGGGSYSVVKLACIHQAYQPYPYSIC